jgi:N-acetylated-alpha-linked acidic dipeptidase
VQFTSKYKEEVLRKGDDNPDFIHAFNAYAPAASVTGELVYVHYARVEDLKKLKDIGVDLTGKIAMARYGKIFRGDKVKICQNAGAIGVIFFSDPGDVAVQGTEPENVYPNTIFLPGSGIQRGTTFIGDGDPLSPNWASVPNAHRVEPESVVGLPKIPAQPIGYDDAEELLKIMGGEAVPEEWQGKIKGLTYKLGGVMQDNSKIRLSTHNYRGTVKSSNVLGYIRGSVEPDRYVIMSNHRDAWGYGAVDPSSGTAQLMEVVRSLGALMKNGWRPRRTLVFASWAADEAGIEGSYEFVYHHTAKLMHRTVGMVNTDICVAGPIAKPQSSPVLKDVTLNSLKMASDPTTDTGRSYYEFWDEWTNQVL